MQNERAIKTCARVGAVVSFRVIHPFRHTLELSWSWLRRRRRGSPPAPPPQPGRAVKSKTPCWKTLINDWYDGRIDGIYAIHCYREALKHLPADVDTYSSARDDIKQALQRRITQGHSGSNGTNGGTSGGGAGGGGTSGGGTSGGGTSGSGNTGKVPGRRAARSGRRSTPRNRRRPTRCRSRCSSSAASRWS